MEKMKACLLLLSIMLAYSEAAKILVVFPLPFRSHGNLGDGAVRNLLKAGHEVTYITPFPYKDTSANFRLIDVSSILDMLPEGMLSIESLMGENELVIDYGMVIYIMTEMMKAGILHENVQKLLNDPKEQFDVVVAEWEYSDLPSGYAAVFNCPLIYLTTAEISWMYLNMIDQPSNPAYTTDAMSPYSPPLNFKQRVSELWIQLKTLYIKYSFLDGMQDSAYQSHIAPIVLKRGRQPPSFDEVRYNVSLILGNSYVSMGQATPIPQSYKSIGGYHIDEKVVPLTEDLKKIMDNAKNGVIYFSMGSSLKSKDFPAEIKKNLFKMFGTLKQIVLWKFEEELSDLPSNVHILKWAPQAAILSHPNCVLFITHGGLLSTTEAIHFGVPIIGIPVFADQFTNVIRAMDKGFAQRVFLSYTMADELKKTIGEVIFNPRYSQKAKELSLIHHDRPMKPGAELVHWVNHVIKTRGAPHLRSPGLQVPFYQKMYLDLAAILAAILIAVLILLKRVYSMLFSKKKNDSQKKKN